LAERSNSVTNNRLTPTRIEIVAIRAVVKHGTIRAAAEALSMSPHTIKTYVDGLRGKSGKRYLPQLIAWATESGLMDDGQQNRHRSFY
jgi:DNA-binding NarL/FixJ family response regulator